jgi:1,4-alpha-glucan branching enzyme
MGNSNGTEVDLSKTEVPKINELVECDPYLKPYEPEIRRRYGLFQAYLKKINNDETSFDKFTKSYETYGMHVDSLNNVNILEWVPAAQNVYVYGDFSKLNGIFYFVFI